MERRKVFQIAAAGVAASVLSQASNAPAGIPKITVEPRKLAAPCGLYCGVCPEYMEGRCHMCGCSCGQCAGAKWAPGCEFYKCLRSRKLESCADCPEMPCTRIIMRASDPVHTCGACTLENLRRIKKIGADAWVAEQREYWSDQKKRERWTRLIREDWAKKP